MISSVRFERYFSGTQRPALTLFLVYHLCSGVASSESQPIIMSVILSTALCIIIYMLSLYGHVTGQTCTEDEISILLNTPQKLCEGNEVTVHCRGVPGLIEIYRDGIIIYNGTSLAPELQSREVYPSEITLGNSCLSVLLSFQTATLSDTGNYTCRTNVTESSALRLVVEPQINQHDCLISSPTGPVVENGENITCSSTTGRPSWVNVNPAATLVNTGYTSVTALAFHAVNSTLLTTLECNVASLPSSSCPSTSTSCSDRIVVVPNPVDSYLSLTPSVAIVQSGGSATFSCTTSLNSATVEPVISPDAMVHSTIRRSSDNNIQISFSNITTNFTEPIVECTLQYNDRTATSAFASVVVLEAEEVITTILPTTTSRTSTLMVTKTTDYTSLNSTPTVNQNTTIYSLTTEGFTESTTIVNVRSYLLFDTRYLIIGLVLGLLVFVAIIVLCALLFRHNAKRKGKWTISSTSRRRGQNEVASGGLEGRLEWETDINPLVVFETTTVDAMTPDDDNSDDDGSLTHDDLEDSRVTMSNGYTKHVSEASPVLRFDAVIENHVPHEPDASKVDDDSVRGRTNQGYTPDHQVAFIHHVDTSDVPSKTVMDSSETCDSRTDQEQQQIPNGHVAVRESDIDEPVHKDTESEVDIASLNFIDATRLDTSESDRDWESGFSLERDSILSEIDEDAINIITV